MNVVRMSSSIEDVREPIEDMFQQVAMLIEVGVQYDQIAARNLGHGDLKTGLADTRLDAGNASLAAKFHGQELAMEFGIFRPMVAELRGAGEDLLYRNDNVG